ncbi:MAG: hypothetical protein GEU79_09020 [Acidimicrobiia bacterium]|nr:hypothetical protein [Acidimicrobiia bacterium]
MSNDLEPSDKRKGAEKEDTRPDEEGLADASPEVGWPLPSLVAFSSVQRMLASMDFSAIHAARRAINVTDAFKEIVEAQDAIAENFARSLDFSRIAATHKALTHFRGYVSGDGSAKAVGGCPRQGHRLFGAQQRGRARHLLSLC